MREPYTRIVQGSASGLVFAAFAVSAGLLVGWPGADVLSAAIIAFCGGAALEHFLRRRYGLAGVFIVGALALVALSMRPGVPVATAIREAATAEEAAPGPAASPQRGDGSAPRSRDDRRRTAQERPRPAAGEATPATETPTTVRLHNPSAVPVSVTYEYAGGSLELGAVGAGATSTFEVPTPAPLQFGTFTAHYGDRTVQAHAFLRRGASHQVDLPQIRP